MVVVPGHGRAAVPDDLLDDRHWDAGIGAKADEAVTERVRTVLADAPFHLLFAVAEFLGTDMLGSSDGSVKPDGIDQFADILTDSGGILPITFGDFRKDVTAFAMPGFGFEQCLAKLRMQWSIL